MKNRNAILGVTIDQNDKNGLVDLNDVTNVYNAATAFATCYIQQDMYGDNICGFE